MNFLVYGSAVMKYVIYGVSVFFTGKLTASVDVLDVLALRFVLSFGVLWLLKILKIVKIDVGIKDFFVKNEKTPFVKNLILASLFEPVLYMTFETLGISMTTGITAGVILSLAPVSSCICEEIFLKEKTTAMQKILLALGIVGVAYIAVNTDTSGEKDSALGILLMLLAVLTGSLFATFSRTSSRTFSALEITYTAALMGMIVFNAVNIIRHLYMGTILTYFNPYFNFDNMVGFIFLGIISAVVATGMNNFALSKMQVSTMSAFGGLSTLVTVAAGVIFAKEPIYTYHLIGLTLIVVRMVGVSYIEIKRQAVKSKNN